MIFSGFLDVPDGLGVPAEALVRGLAGGAVDAQVEGSRVQEGGSEFARSVSGVAVEAQGQHEVALGQNEKLGRRLEGQKAAENS